MPFSRARLEDLRRMEAIIQVRHPILYNYVKRKVYPILGFDSYYGLLKLLLEILEEREVRLC